MVCEEKINIPLFPGDRHNTVHYSREGKAYAPLPSSHFYLYFLLPSVSSFLPVPLSPPSLLGLDPAIPTLQWYKICFYGFRYFLFLKRTLNFCEKAGKSRKSDNDFSILHSFYKGVFKTTTAIETVAKTQTKPIPNKSSKKIKHILLNSTCYQQCYVTRTEELFGFNRILISRRPLRSFVSPSVLSLFWQWGKNKIKI